jgi:hypothetical protein
VDTGGDVRLVRKNDGWHILDTLEPAWYRIYGVVKEGEKWRGPGPLPEGPPVLNLTAIREARGGGVRLDWSLPFEDWVGCAVARYRIYRGGGGEPTLLTEIHGRVMRGPSELVSSYVDDTAVAGKKHTYRVQVVTPLRRLGPLSEPATVGGTDE